MENLNVGLITIVVPIYNSEKYINKCIDSIVNQSFKNIEIILVDDGSTDRTLEICTNYAQKDERIRCIHKENGGVSSARNTGIDNAHGEYICFVDSDDAIKEDYVSLMYEKINSNNSEFVIFGFSTNKEELINNYDIKATTLNANEWNKLSKLLIIKEKINSPISKLYKTEIIKNNNIRFDSEISVGEDMLFNMIYLKNVSTIYYSATPIYWYRKENLKSLSSMYNPEKINNLMYINKELQSLYKDNKYFIEALNAIKVKGIYSCYKDVIKKNKLEINQFITYAKKTYNGKINVNIKFLFYFLEAFFYNNKMFKTIYKILKRI